MAPCSALYKFNYPNHLLNRYIKRQGKAIIVLEFVMCNHTNFWFEKKPSYVLVIIW